MKIITSKEMRELEDKAEKAGISRAKMMENAGKNSALYILKMFPAVKKKKVLVVCGKGNNGGDGLVCARYLEQNNIRTTVFILNDKKNISGLSKRNLRLLEKTGSKVNDIKQQKGLPEDLNNFHIVIDAIFGTGFKGKVSGLYLSAIKLINSCSSKKISIDLPSGLDSDSGKAFVCVKADWTFTLGLPKQGLYLSDGVESAGKIKILDIGIPTKISVDSNLNLIEKKDIYSFPKRKIDSHKGSYGQIFIIAGSPGFTGAAALAGLSALYSGSGLVTVGIPKSLNRIMAIKLTEVMTKPLPETNSGTISMRAYADIKEWAMKLDAMAIGPGISRQKETLSFARKIIQNIDIPLVVDADGLFALKNNTQILKKRKAFTVITPHMGEMSYLTGISIQRIRQDKISVALKFSKKYNTVVVLKGPATVIAFPDGDVWINQTGNPGMAKGGSGDVLTGILVSLIGQGIELRSALKTAVYIHGIAGDMARNEKGEISMTPSDLIAKLPRIFKALTSRQGNK